MNYNAVIKKETFVDSIAWWSYSDNPVAIGLKNRIIAYPTPSSGLTVRGFSGKKIFTINNNEDKIYAAFLSPDESYLIASDYSKKMFFFDLSGRKLNEVSLNDTINLNWHTLKFFPNGEQFVVGAYDGIYFFSKNGSIQKRVELQGDVTTLDISNDGSYLICGANGLSLLDSTGKILVTVETPHPTQTTKVRFSPNKKVFASLGVYGSVRLWDFDGRLLYDFKEMPIAWNVTFHDDKILISGRNEVKIWTLPNLPEDFLMSN
jgi:WD40 repeat protein